MIKKFLEVKNILRGPMHERTLKLSLDVVSETNIILNKHWNEG